MTVGKAYLIFYELYEGYSKPWLPFVIILGWILIINTLAWLGLHKAKFTETSQSLPSHSKTPAVNNYSDNNDSGSQSINCNDENSKDYNDSIRSSFSSANGKMKGNRVDDEWTEEFRVDLETDELSIPVEPVTLLFEDISFNR